MEKDSYTSIIPIGLNSLVKAQNLISITDKILAERNVISQHHWDWWNGLSDIWKKIFNAGIGKIACYPSIPTANYIHTYGTFETPSTEELFAIINIESIKYSPFSLYSENQCPLTDLDPIKELKKLTKFCFSGNRISDLGPLKELINLTELECNLNRISDLGPLKELINLTKLSCRINKITFLNPLKKLENLTELDCHWNQISDLSPVKELKNLTKLYCGANPIYDFNPLKELKNLTYLEIKGTRKIDLTTVSELRKFNPNLKIDF